MILVVMVDDSRNGAGPGTVIEVASDPVRTILARYEDRDGARSERLRLWRAYRGAAVGDRVALDISLGPAAQANKRDPDF